MSEPGFSAELVEDVADPVIGRERIRVRFDDGRVQELRLHDYAAVYSLPGVYEQIVQERLGCRSPDEMARLLGAAADGLGWDRAAMRVIDLAAGNGVSGAALQKAGLRPVLGTDIVPEARAAALRDRPGLYGDYVTLDLLRLSAPQRAMLDGLGATAIGCVAVVGDRPGELPPAALLAAATALEPDGLVSYMHDPASGAPDVVDAALWRTLVGEDGRAEELRRRRWLHRCTVNGAPYELEGVIWRLRRERGGGGGGGAVVQAQ